MQIVRGNISEIKTLAAGSGTTRGVDADVADAITEENLDEAVCFAKEFARQNHVIAAITGAIDLVTDGQRCHIIRNGRPEMGRITGTGCQLSGMMSAYAAANPDHLLEACAAAVCVMGLAGRDRLDTDAGLDDGNSTVPRFRIIDAIDHMDGCDAERKEPRDEVR